jgi:hypothetical protein
MTLAALSEELRVSRRTIVGWVDRHLIDAKLAWRTSTNPEERRVIVLDESSRTFLKGFADEYREDTVSRTDARHILRKIDASQVKRLIRTGDFETKEEGEDLRVVVGSIEDYLIEREQVDPDA